MKFYIRLILLGFILMSKQGIAQDLEKITQIKPKEEAKKQLDKLKSIKVGGNIAANNTFYKGFGAYPLGGPPPLAYVYTGNLNINLFSKIAMPLQFSFSNQGASWAPIQNPLKRYTLPFNRFVLKPTYKGFTLHTGTCALNFSPLTLSGLRYMGLGLEYKPKKGPIYFSIMQGKLRPEVRIDSSGKTNNNRPSYKRTGVGFMVGYKKDKDLIELIFFTAKDKIGSFRLDAKGIMPEANTVGSLKFSKNLYKNWFVDGEFAISGLSNPEAVVGNKKENFFKSYFNTLPLNSSTIYRKSIKSMIGYKAKTMTIGFDYQRVDPEYRTLGAYYFVNDMESFTGNIMSSLKDGKISLTANAGLMHDNLDKKKFQTMNRWVGAFNANWAVNDKLNFTGGYSNFLSYSNLRSSYDYLTQIAPYDALDTLNYRQINQNITTVANWIMKQSEEKTSFLSGNIVYQKGGDQQGTTTQTNQLLNTSLNYGYTLIKKKMTIAGGFIYGKNTSPAINTTFLGPSLTFNKAFGEQLKTSSGITYSQMSNNGKAGNTLLNMRASANYTIKKKHNFGLVIMMVNKMANSNNTETNQKSYTDLTSTLSYSYQFSVVDTNKK